MKITRPVALAALSVMLFSCAPGVAVKEFKNLPKGFDPVTIGGRVAEQFLSTDPNAYAPVGYNGKKPVGNKKMVQYSTVSLWVNSLEFARETSNKELESRLVRHFEPFYGEKKDNRNVSNHVDHTIFGAVPLEIAVLNGDERAKELGLYYADRQWAAPDPENLGGNGNFPYDRQLELFNAGYSPQTRLWIDDMYMINVLQTQAYRLTKDKKYIDRAAKEMVMYIDSLQLSNGLFYHAPDVPFIWGRGDGWMAAGMPMILKFLDEGSEYYAPIKKGYLSMMESLLKFQHKNGLWGQLVVDPESWEETSCSAMFTYGFIEGIKHGWLDESVYGPAARNAWIALCSRLDEHANLPDVCVGTNRKDDRDWYLNRPRVNGDPHGQAPMMWICAALLEK